eukprot:GEMP01046828.1.p1 GENE.GEMP01046828.1~~GEMP01046828.1.p1  ORF type:complete len:420 (+),score=103.82 GEMP01046828.1:38-1261(+)
MSMSRVALTALAPFTAAGPPMGWMSWAQFYCRTDCDAHPHGCINEALYKDHADMLVDKGYAAVGYNSVHIDDCWSKKPAPGVSPRDDNGEIISDPIRFPSGMKALGDYMHERGIKFGLYTDIGTLTCGGYEGTLNHEETDATSFAKWGVDYIKVDGCYANQTVFDERYKKLGDFMKKAGRKIQYSCSWPAYLGDNEDTKPFDRMIAAGCDTWRNWSDISNTLKSIRSIIQHWAKYNATLSAIRGAWNDPDMILGGNDAGGHVLPTGVAKIQLAVWSIVNAPLIMSNNLRTVTEEYQAILQNKEMIAVNQFGGHAGGVRREINPEVSIWAKWVENDDLAVALVNTGNTTAEVHVDWAELFGSQPAHVRDIFSGQLVDIQDKYDVNEADVLFLKAIRSLYWNSDTVIIS